MKKNVCIIGAGVTGLAAIRHISSSPSLNGTVFDETYNIGGVWIYKPKIESADYEFSPLYKNMRTNLPKEVMGFPDFPFPDAFSPNPSSSFMHHTEVRHFLESYAAHFDLRKYIQLRRRITDVRPKHSGADGADPRWCVSVQHMDKVSNQGGGAWLEHLEFDAILVCNGHLSKPFIPDIPNIEAFQGVVLHSKSFDEGIAFAGKRVVVVGCGPSGIDISLEIAQFAEEVIISNKFRKEPLAFKLLPNMREVCKIKAATSDGFLLENGDIINCDVLLVCTGYLYDFPFLSPECEILVEKSQRISPLYHDMVSIEYPSMCFIGLQDHVNRFFLFDLQARYCTKLFEGAFELPGKEDMKLKMKEDRRLQESLGYPLRWTHHLRGRQWDYFEALAQEAGLEVPIFFPLLQQVYEKVGKRRLTNSAEYKNDLIFVQDKELNLFNYVEFSYH